MNKTDKIPDGLITKFLSGKRLTNDEIILLDRLFNDETYSYEISDWLKNIWQKSESTAVAVKFEEIRKRIKISSKQNRINRLFLIVSKAAAFLFIPLLAAALYLFANQFSNDELFTLATQKGEQTSVILPDGSKVWLNVDTRLSYPVNFGVRNRELILEGEAYFEVEKNEKLPFEVTSGNITTKAIGTQFLVSAYPESEIIKTSLLQGLVEVKLTGRENPEKLKPGQQICINKNSSNIEIKPFDEGFELGWKNNELVFQLTPFDEVITILEKWYDIHIEYNPELFQTETLTVRFEKYETLENILKVISIAAGFSYSIEDKYIMIMKEKQ